ncbi:MAG: hypothetical protein ACI8Z9_002501, partial [Paraglaciecola sp.]
MAWLRRPKSRFAQRVVNAWATVLGAVSYIKKKVSPSHASHSIKPRG